MTVLHFSFLHSLTQSKFYYLAQTNIQIVVLYIRGLFFSTLARIIKTPISVKLSEQPISLRNGSFQKASQEEDLK